MNITAKQYAAGFFASVKGSDRSEARKMAGRLAGIMSQNNDLDLANDVEKEFTRLWRQEAGEAVVEVSCSRPLDRGSEKKIKNYIMEKFHIKKVEIEQEIDEKILGGIIIRYQDTILDGCLETMLKNLKQELIK